MLYRTDGPNEVVWIEGDYRPHRIDSADVVAADAGDPRSEPLTLLSNDDVALAISRRRQAMPNCSRNIDGDLLYFVHRGSGVFATEFGPLHCEPGDYILLPKETTFRLDDQQQTVLIIGHRRRSRSACASTSRLVGIHRSIRPVLQVPDVADYGWPKQDDEDPQGRRPGRFAFTPQGVLHGANEAFRAEFQAQRRPGMRRTRAGIGIDTYRPLDVSPEFARLTS